MATFTDTKGLAVRRARWHYDNGVGTVEVLVPIDHLIYSPDHQQGVMAQHATPEDFKAYAMRLLTASVEQS